MQARLDGGAGRDVEQALLDWRWGLERETHRICPDGSLSRRPHPPSLKRPAFTRDFAETQLEIVTPPRATIAAALFELNRLTALADQSLGSELVWPFSMPPRLPDEAEIAIADLGSDETARRGRLYRHGLAVRYGMARQMICGLHLNVSFGARLAATLAEAAPLTRDELGAGGAGDAYYLRLARNLYHDLPLLVLLTGTSPVRGGGRESEPYAVSYRNSRYGYARDEFLSYLDLTSLDDYLSGIQRGLRTESPQFARLGLVHAGRPVQLNASAFQIDKEFYAPIRLRQTLGPGESTVQALSRRGVGYLELRFLDVDPASRSGAQEDTLRLLHLFLLDGLARRSNPRAQVRLRRGVEAAAEIALRDPETLASDPLMKTAAHRLADLEPWAERLDGGHGQGSYRLSLAAFWKRILDPATLPSASLARALADSGLDWTSFGARQAADLRQGADDALADARL